ncbi:acyl-CoA carboxylase subunit epsilon [Nakamurella sp. YIM 132087]|uniref:Acyl-CoA carboxylase subunit epsilon n=1 Tax=Nakamurella alba TaxID=2665158 RepID=A0A7K1FJ54_9ACTN|nr:acyl-CoA carboxylase subunit epsilon [Nakamurella alba]MTD14165.1 acyl-CoA carboxylase subunit epsilon [Nakamurella alba]
MSERTDVAADEDAAVVLAVVNAVLAGAGEPEPVAPRSVWSDPSFRRGRPAPGPLTWWASGSRR